MSWILLATPDDIPCSPNCTAPTLGDCIRDGRPCLDAVRKVFIPRITNEQAEYFSAHGESVSPSTVRELASDLLDARRELREVRRSKKLQIAKCKACGKPWPDYMTATDPHECSAAQRDSKHD